MIRHSLFSAALTILPLMSQAGPYSLTIEDAAGVYMPATEIDEAALLRSVLHAESGMHPYAVSPVGARGLAQFMPETWAEVATSIGTPEASPYESTPAISGAAFYLTSLYQKWIDDRSPRDRWSLALASYNAGFGNVLKAQKKCGGCPQYSKIIEHLPSVTGSHADETTTYVSKIWGYYDD